MSSTACAGGGDGGAYPAEALPVLDLPTDRPRRGTPTPSAAHPFSLPDPLAAAVHALAGNGEAGTRDALLAAFAAVLHRTTGAADLGIGTATGAGAPLRALRLDLSGDPSFRALLDRVALARDAATAAPFLDAVALRLLDGGEGRVEYAPELFEPASAARLADHALRLLAAGTDAPDAPLSTLPWTDDAEHALLARWSGREAEYPREATVHALFGERAAAAPERVALVGDGAPVTYGELDARSARIARFLRRRGVKDGDAVGIAMERSADTVAAVLGVLRAGGAYLPVDAAHPPARVERMLADAGARVALIRDRLPPSLSAFPGLVLSLAEEAEGIAREEATPPRTDACAGSPAHVTFTSGSTGVPKGVVVPHRAVVRLARSGDLAAAVPEEVVLHASPLVFDPSALELWGTLLNGARLAILPGGVPSLPALAAVLREHAVTRAWLAAGLFHAMVDERPEALRGLRQLSAGGEALSVPHVRRALDRLPGTEVVNGYGPTENGSYTTRRVLRPADVERPGVPIGEPVENTRVFILDDALRPVPVGVPGELYAAGDGLALGYAGQPARTAERFVPLPLGGTAGARAYRTGDRARWLPCGTLEFLGRLDGQVKVRGYRVEPGEVEAVLAAEPSVREVCVALHGEGPGARLVAWVAGREDARPDAHALHEAAKARLPAYMVPERFVLLSALPRTPTGKVDRRALPAPADALPAPATGARAEDAATLEARIAAVWREVLERPEVPVDAPFFSVGGNSLLLVTLHARLAEEIPEVETLEVLELFRHPTVRALARRLRGEPAEEAPQTQPRRDERPGPDAVAVVGMALRLPGADDPDALWANLRDGVESLSDVSDAALLEAGVPVELLDDPRYVRWRGRLEGIDRFDAGFFGIAPDEAALLDPQQRILLECAWEAMERAGHPPGEGARDVAVYVGASPGGYHARLAADPATVARVGGMALRLAGDRDFLATRLAHALGTEGAALTVQTACSTSLVAVHLAAAALRAGECRMALAGGVSVQVPHAAGYLYHPGGVASPDGHCRAFDADARGTGIGCGAAMVLLKRLDDALADGDTVHAVVLGSAVNNDGGARMGFTAPRAEGQAAVVRAALRAAGVEPDSVGMVEAHGTGTELGDPVEVAALSEAFATHRSGFCALGTVKTNLGHLDAAAGIAGMLRAVLALEREAVPPSLHFRTPNPRARLEGSPFFVNSALHPWPRGEAPRRAGVSAFGMGGTNAHVVLEEPPAPAPATPAPRRELLLLSARTPDAADAAVARLAAHLRAHPGLPLADVAHTLRVGRRHFAVRRALVVRAGEDVPALLETPPTERWAAGGAADLPDAPLFVFPAFPSAPRGEWSPGVAEAVERVLETVRALGGPGGDPHPAALAFAHGCARVERWAALGLRPGTVVGDGGGAIAAAWAAGLVSRADAAARVAAIAAGTAPLPGWWARAADGSERRGAEARALAEAGGPDASVAGSDAAAELLALARYWAAGGEVAWASFDPGARRRRVPLPTYPFERTRHWLEPGARAAPSPAEHGHAPQGRTPRDALSPEPAGLRPEGETERRIAALWEEVLGIEGIGAEDDFFVLGGHSITAIRLLGRVESELAVQLPVRTLFDAPTVAGLAAAVEEARPAGVDGATLERMLDELRDLSPDDLRAILDDDPDPDPAPQ